MGTVILSSEFTETIIKSSLATWNGSEIRSYVEMVNVMKMKDEDSKSGAKTQKVCRE